MECVRPCIKTTLNNQFQNFIISKCKQFSISPQKVLIDFSSPNIAKPFHVGHLRATLLGNFLVNINKIFRHEVRKINYLGDWGTQFGYLLHGLKKDNSKDLEFKDPLKYFYEIYVKSYQAFQGPEHLNSIRETLLKLENGDVELINSWKNVKDISLEKIKFTYQRLGIEFDSYEFESDYAKISKQLIGNWKREAIRTNTAQTSFVEQDGAVYYTIDSQNKVPMITREGFSLYLTRDVAAAINRIEKYKPDRIHYVVEDGQSLHFQLLEKMLKNFGYQINKLNCDSIAQPIDMHIKFAKVSNMSTRKGKVIFVDDILNFTKNLVLKKLTDENKVTRTKSEKIDDLTEKLSITILFCEFLRVPRQNPFDYVWTRDNFGFKLQYCRTSLNSLEERCFNESIDPVLVDCFDFSSYNEFKNYYYCDLLVKHMETWDSVMFQCYMESESCYLVTYLTKMVSLINKSLRELRILNAPSKEEAQSRLKLFSVAKFILDINYSLLGVPEVESI